MGGINDTITLHVAGSLEEVSDVINLAIWRFLFVTLLATLVTGLVLWPLTSFVVWPISDIAARIASIDIGLLNARIDADHCPTELKPVADRLNELVSRLRAAFAREQQTTANIAHELRTPLSGLKATIELAESKSRSTAYYQQTLSDCRRITDELQALVERILLLARLDANRLSITAEPVDLRELLLQVWQEISSQLPVPGSNPEWNLAESLPVETDRACVRQILRNMLSNAMTHGDQSQPVSIAARVTTGNFTIQVVNSCSGLSPTDIPRLKERFFQIDENRAGTGRNAGLGLSIADQLARSLGGSLDLELLDWSYWIGS